MKAKFDFGYIKKEERNFIKSLLDVLLSSNVEFSNKQVSFDIRRQRAVFKLNEYYFSISFSDEILTNDEIKIFDALRVFDKNNLSIKRIPDFASVFPVFEEECIFKDRKIYFSTPYDISSIKKEFLEDNLVDIFKKYNAENKSISVSIYPTLLATNIKKVSKNILNLTLANTSTLKAPFLERELALSNLEITDDKLIFTVINNEGELMENENTTKDYNKADNTKADNNKADNIEVKATLYIGSIDIDLKSLVALKEGDKIILDRDEKINAILKIGSKDVLSGELTFDEKNISFLVNSCNF
ncbi:MAG: hypothetical protein ACOX3T_08045 [Bdellovibrionota bacterium]